MRRRWREVEVVVAVGVVVVVRMCRRCGMRQSFQVCPVRPQSGEMMRCQRLIETEPTNTTFSAARQRVRAVFYGRKAHVEERCSIPQQNDIANSPSVQKYQRQVRFVVD